MLLSSMGLFLVILGSMIGMIASIMLLPLDPPLVILLVMSGLAAIFLAALMLAA